MDFANFNTLQTTFKENMFECLVCTKTYSPVDFKMSCIWEKSTLKEVKLQPLKEVMKEVKLEALVPNLVYPMSVVSPEPIHTVQSDNNSKPKR